MKLESRKIGENILSAAGDSPERIALTYPVGEGPRPREVVGEAHRRWIPGKKPGESKALESFDEMRDRALGRLEKKVEAALA